MNYVDLHRHLEGSITPFVAQRIGKPLQSRWDRKTDFFKSWHSIYQYIDSEEISEKVIFYSLEELSRKGVLYVEFSISPAEFLTDTFRLFGALWKGLQRARQEFSIEANLIYNLTRHLPEKIEDDLQCAGALYDNKLIVGLGLSGDEINFPLSVISKYIRPLLRPDIPKTIHAGEFSGVEEIRSAISLGANRIGHGATLLNDPGLTEYVKTQRVGIEVCITSELALGNVQSLSSHPVFDFERKNILFNLNTDDPAVFETEIDLEYKLVRNKIDPGKITQNALDMAFIDEKLKAKLRSAIR